MVYIDANIIVRYLLKDNDEQFIFSKNIIEGDLDLYVPNEIIVEIIYVLNKIYKITKSQTSQTIIELINKNYFSLDSKPIIVNALNLFASKNLDFVDCILCATSRLTDNRVETFDKGLRNCIKE
ncbi:MAG: PIN domain-containing protein [Bacteroidota bacterium]|nr:PIN domain-containing protein [Bacteroidota bacterium]